MADSRGKERPLISTESLNIAWQERGLSDGTAVLRDAIDLLDALRIGRAIVAGHDWGARIAYAIAALWPERVQRLVAISVEYQTGIIPGSRLDYVQQRAYWFQWFFASEHGREALADNRRGLCRELWRMWSPTWSFDDESFTETAGPVPW